MIQANHLRIGNLIIDQNGNYRKVLFLEHEGIVLRQSWGTAPDVYDPNSHRHDVLMHAVLHKEVVAYSVAQPVLITHNILLALGFNHRSETGNLYDIPYMITNLRDGKLIDKGFCVALFDDINFVVALHANHTHIQSVHHLQNIYFDQSGIELAFNIEGNKLSTHA